MFAFGSFFSISTLVAGNLEVAKEGSLEVAKEAPSTNPTILSSTPEIDDAFWRIWITRKNWIYTNDYWIYRNYLYEDDIFCAPGGFEDECAVCQDKIGALCYIKGVYGVCRNEGGTYKCNDVGEKLFVNCAGGGFEDECTGCQDKGGELCSTTDGSGTCRNEGGTYKCIGFAFLYRLSVETNIVNCSDGGFEDECARCQNEEGLLCNTTDGNGICRNEGGTYKCIDGEIEEKLFVNCAGGGFEDECTGCQDKGGELCHTTGGYGFCRNEGATHKCIDVAFLHRPSVERNAVNCSGDGFEDECTGCQDKGGLLCNTIDGNGICRNEGGTYKCIDVLFEMKWWFTVTQAHAQKAETENRRSAIRKNDRIDDWIIDWRNFINNDVRRNQSDKDDCEHLTIYSCKFLTIAEDCPDLCKGEIEKIKKKIEKIDEIKNEIKNEMLKSPMYDGENHDEL